MTLLETIQKYGPFTPKALWSEIVDMRRASPCSDYPLSPIELDVQCQALAKSGLVEKRDGEWHHIPQPWREPVAAGTEKQGALFA